MVARLFLAIVLVLLTAACSADSETVAGESGVLLAKLVTAESELVISRAELDSLAAARGVTVVETTGPGSTQILAFDPPLPAALVKTPGIVPATIATLVGMGPLAQADTRSHDDTPQLFALPGDVTGIRAVLFLREEGISAAAERSSDQTLILIEGIPGVRIRGNLPDCDSDLPSTIEVQRLVGDRWATEAELSCDLLGVQGY
jgi:hypothetical protein